MKLQYDLFEYGIIKRRLWEGDTEDAEEWRIGHPQIFPDDRADRAHGQMGPVSIPAYRKTTRTRCTIGSTRVRAGVPKPADVPMWENPWQSPEAASFRRCSTRKTRWCGSRRARSLITPPSISRERRGVILYRKTLLEQAARVEQGFDPLGVVRDPAKNTPWLALPVEQHFTYSLAGLPSSVAYDFPDREIVPAV